jgi:glycosyltransferase involved in cell wall biosynthesis
MKILYIGHYREFGGWAQAATDQILALDKAGVDVVCRNVTLTKDRKNIHPKIEELEKKDSTHCDICIQHVLPHHLVGSSQFKKNIAFFEGESLSIKTLPWFCQLELMDEVWVPNNDLLLSLVADKLKTKTRLIHHATDINKYKKAYKSINVSGLLSSGFKFYYVGDMNDRKNIGSIFRCFHSEFDKSENVSLLIKVNKFGMSPEQVHQQLDQISKMEKKSIRMYPSLDDYKRDSVISIELSNDDLYSLHNYGNCFICPSHGEAWSIPSLDALGFGNTPICSKFGGPKEFINPDNAYTGCLVDGVFSCCQCSDAAFPDMFTGREWFQPCEKQIRTAMRHYYEAYLENPIAHKQRAIESGLSTVEKFSYDNIGQQMLEALNDV